ncbi:exocyst complex component 4-like [Symsagittifera roscoffensis]|uniref:exocyst complex component 4-like n=1 Tax=Symsagittifera roscoffensis TaxID=84072 RepID=UPI00307BE341
MPSFAGDFNRVGDANSGRSTTRLLISVIRKLSEHSGDASLREEERRKLEDSYGVVDDRLKKIVRAKQDGLNRTVDDFQAICSNVHKASLSVAKVKLNLAACKDQIKCKRDELKRLHNEAAEQSMVLDIFERIDTISNTSTLISSLIEQKKYSKAAEIVQKVSNDYQMLSEVATVSGITLPLDIKEHLFGKVVSQIQYVLYEQSVNGTKTQQMTKTKSQTRQVGVFTQTHPDKARKSVLFSTATKNVSNESFEETINELVFSLSALNMLSDASKALQANFMQQVERIFISSQTQLSNFYGNTGTSGLNHEEHKKLVFSELFELIFVKLVKIVDRKNFFIQKMNIAILQSAKGSSFSIKMYSIADFLETFQQAVIEILFKFLVESSKDHSINSNAGKFYLNPATPNSKMPALQSSNETSRKQYVSFASSLTKQKGNNKSRHNLSEPVRNAQSLPSISESAQRESLITPSIMNITLIDKPLNKISKYICEQLACSKEQCSLYVSKENLVNKNLFNYLSQKLKRVLEDSLPKDGIGSIVDSRSTLAKLESDQALSDATIVVHEQLTYLADISKNMPTFNTKLEELTSQFLGGFYSRLHQKYISLLSIPDSESHVSTVLKLLGAKNMKSILKETKSWTEIAANSGDDLNGDVFTTGNNNFIDWSVINSQIFETLANFGGQKSLNSVITSSSEACQATFQSLAIINVSISWLFCQDYQHVAAQLASGKGEITRTIDGLETVSETCLLACNLELKVASFCFLSQLFEGSKSSSFSAQSSIEVHSKVKELIRVIYEAEMIFTRFFGTKKFDFVFDGLPHFIEKLCISSVDKCSELSSSSSNFIDRFLLDVAELKRAFRNISHMQNVRVNNFDSILSYFELLKYPPNDLVRVSLENEVQFNEKEWIAVLVVSAKKFNKFLDVSGKVDLGSPDLAHLVKNLSPVTKQELTNSPTVPNGVISSL